MNPIVNIPTGASGYRQSIVSQAQAAQRTVNNMQMSPRLNPNGFVQPLGKITNAASEFQKSMDASAARVFAFGAAVGVINGISDAFKTLVTSAVEVEKSLKDIQVVMEATDSAMQKFGDGLFDVARNTATSFDLVAASATELARQGLSAEETLARVNSALILSRLSGLDTVKSTETLTAAINSFNKEGITHEQIVNRMANVDAAFAVSSADLAEAISRAGAVAQSSGVSFNQLSAIVTAVQQRTARGGSVIGNGFKSIFTRIKRSGVREALEEIGVTTKEMDGSFRSSIDIIKDYAKVYQTLTDTQKAYTSEQIAGVFQIQNLQALIQDLNSGYSVFNKALSVANNTTDQATQRNKALNETLDAIFKSTTLSVKELSASLGSLAFEDSFKSILKFVGNLADSLNGLFDEETGSSLAKNLVKGIGAWITGPGAVLLGAAFFKIFSLVGKFAKDAFKDLLGINMEAKRQQSLQAAIGSILMKNESIYKQILAASGNSARQEQIILNIVKQETAERVKQEALIKRIASSSALVGVGAGDTGFVPMGKRASRKRGKQTLGLAGGYLPSINKEHHSISKGVGGARRGDRPVVLKNHSMGGGKKQTVVAHTGEWRVPNFGGSGGDAIFNRSMVKKFGLPSGAKKITAADGLIPNFAKGTQKVTATAAQLGWKEVVGRGRPNEIGKRSDRIDSFTGRIKLERLNKTSSQIGTMANQTLSGKGSVKSRSLPFFIPKGDKYILNPQYKDANDAIKQKLTNQFGKKALASGTGLNLKNQIQTLSAGFDKRKSAIKFKSLNTLLKGLHGEKLAISHLKNKGVKAEAIESSGFFDLKTSRRKFEVKSGKKINNFEILKKAASEFLMSSGGDKESGYPFKNKIAERIDVSRKAGLGRFINLVLPKGSPSENVFDKKGQPVIQAPRSAASGFIPNFARRFTDVKSWGGARSKKLKDTGSYLEYEGDHISHIASQKKGDANLLFDKFMKQKGTVTSGGLTQNRSFKENSKSNFEDLMYAFPQLQYRLKKGLQTTGRYVGADGDTFRFQSLIGLKEQINKKYRRGEFRDMLGNKSGPPGMGSMDIQDLVTSRVSGAGDNIYKNYAEGLVPNFAAGVLTSKGFFTPQKIRRLRDGEFSKTESGDRIYLSQFSKQDQDKITGFDAQFSNKNVAKAAAASKAKKGAMPTIDASRQATMLVATNNLRKKVDSTYKHKGTDFRLKYRVEGLKPSRLKGSEAKLRERMQTSMLRESSSFAKQLSGAGSFGANTPSVTQLSNAGAPGAAAGTVFESALKAVGKNKLFTKNNAGFDIGGYPDGSLQNLFGYYTPFADAKIGLTPDTKRDFHGKLMGLPTSGAAINAANKKKQGQMAMTTRAKYGAPSFASGFIPNLAKFKPKDFGLSDDRANQLQSYVDKRKSEGRPFKFENLLGGSKIKAQGRINLVTKELGKDKKITATRLKKEEIQKSKDFATKRAQAGINTLRSVSGAGGAFAVTKANANSTAITGLEARVSRLESLQARSNVNNFAGGFVPNFAAPELPFNSDTIIRKAVTQNVGGINSDGFTMAKDGTLMFNDRDFNPGNKKHLNSLMNNKKFKSHIHDQINNELRSIQKYNTGLAGMGRSFAEKTGLAIINPNLAVDQSKIVQRDYLRDMANNVEGASVQTTRFKTGAGDAIKKDIHYGGMYKHDPRDRSRVIFNPSALDQLFTKKNYGQSNIDVPTFIEVERRRRQAASQGGKNKRMSLSPKRTMQTATDLITGGFNFGGRLITGGINALGNIKKAGRDRIGKRVQYVRDLKQRFNLSEMTEGGRKRFSAIKESARSKARNLGGTLKGGLEKLKPSLGGVTSNPYETAYENEERLARENPVAQAEEAFLEKENERFNKRNNFARRFKIGKYKFKKRLRGRMTKVSDRLNSFGTGASDFIDRKKTKVSGMLKGFGPGVTGLIDKGGTLFSNMLKGLGSGTSGLVNKGKDKISSIIDAAGSQVNEKRFNPSDLTKKSVSALWKRITGGIKLGFINPDTLKILSAFRGLGSPEISALKIKEGITKKGQIIRRNASEKWKFLQENIGKALGVGGEKLNQALKAGKLRTQNFFTAAGEFKPNLGGEKIKELAKALGVRVQDLRKKIKDARDSRRQSAQKKDPFLKPGAITERYNKTRTAIGDLFNRGVALKNRAVEGGINLGKRGLEKASNLSKMGLAGVQSGGRAGVKFAKGRGGIAVGGATAIAGLGYALSGMFESDGSSSQKRSNAELKQLTKYDFQNAKQKSLTKNGSVVTYSVGPNGTILKVSTDKSGKVKTEKLTQKNPEFHTAAKSMGVTTDKGGLLDNTERRNGRIFVNGSEMSNAEFNQLRKEELYGPDFEVMGIGAGGLGIGAGLGLVGALALVANKQHKERVSKEIDAIEKSTMTDEQKSLKKRIALLDPVDRNSFEKYKNNLKLELTEKRKQLNVAKSDPNVKNALNFQKSGAAGPSLPIPDDVKNLIDDIALLDDSSKNPEKSFLADDGGAKIERRSRAEAVLKKRKEKRINRGNPSALRRFGRRMPLIGSRFSDGFIPNFNRLAVAAQQRRTQQSYLSKKDIKILESKRDDILSMGVNIGTRPITSTNMPFGKRLSGAELDQLSANLRSMNIDKGLIGRVINSHKMTPSEINRAKLQDFIYKNKQARDVGGKLANVKAYKPMNEERYDPFRTSRQNKTASGGLIPNFAPRWRRQKKLNKPRKPGEGKILKDKEKEMQLLADSYARGEISTRKMRELKEKIDPFGVLDDVIQGLFSDGYIPNFSNPLTDAIARESSALSDRGVSLGAIRVEQSNSLKNSRNPSGLAVTNTFDEPAGVQQGINRSRSMGINPKSHGAATGFVPSFAAGIGANLLKTLMNVRNMKGIKQTLDVLGKPVKGVRDLEMGPLKKGFFNSEQMNAGMMASFPLMMLTEQMRASQAEGGGNVYTDIGTEAMMGASFGAMGGVKGAAIGAIGGGIYGATKGFSGERETAKAFADALKRQLDVVGKAAGNITGLQKYAEALSELNQATEEQDIGAMVEAQEDLSNAMISVKDVHLHSTMMDITNSTASFTEKIRLLKREMEDQIKVKDVGEAAAEMTGDAQTQLKKDEDYINTVEGISGADQDKMQAQMAKMLNFTIPKFDREGEISKVAKEKNVSEKEVREDFDLMSGITKKEMTERRDFLVGFSDVLTQAMQKELPSIMNSTDYDTITVEKFAKENLGGEDNIGNLADQRMLNVFSSMFNATGDSNLEAKGIQEAMENYLEKEGVLTRNSNGEIDRSRAGVGSLMDGLAAFNLDSSDGPVTGENAEDGIVQGKEVQRLVAVSRALTSEVDSINSSLKSFDGLTESGNKLIEANKSAEQQVVDLLKSTRNLELKFKTFAEDVKFQFDMASTELKSQQQNLLQSNSLLQQIGGISVPESQRRDSLINQQAIKTQSRLTGASQIFDLIEGMFDAGSINRLGIEDIEKSNDTGDKKDNSGFKKRAADKLQREDDMVAAHITRGLAGMAGSMVKGDTTLNQGMKQLEAAMKGTMAETYQSKQFLSRSQSILKRNQSLQEQQLKELRRQTDLAKVQTAAAKVEAIGGRIISPQEVAQFGDGVTKGAGKKIELGLSDPNSTPLDAQRLSSSRAQQLGAQIQAEDFISNLTGVDLSTLTGRSELDNKELRTLINLSNLDDPMPGVNREDQQKLVDEIAKQAKANFDILRKFEAEQKEKFEGGNEDALYDLLSEEQRISANTLRMAETLDEIIKNGIAVQFDPEALKSLMDPSDNENDVLNSEDNKKIQKLQKKKQKLEEQKATEQSNLEENQSEAEKYQKKGKAMYDQVASGGMDQPTTVQNKAVMLGAERYKDKQEKGELGKDFNMGDFKRVVLGALNDLSPSTPKANDQFVNANLGSADSAMGSLGLFGQGNIYTQRQRAQDEPGEGESIQLDDEMLKEFAKQSKGMQLEATATGINTADRTTKSSLEQVEKAEGKLKTIQENLNAIDKKLKELGVGTSDASSASETTQQDFEKLLTSSREVSILDSDKQATTPAAKTPAATTPAATTPAATKNDAGAAPPRALDFNTPIQRFLQDPNVWSGAADAFIRKLMTSGKLEQFKKERSSDPETQEKHFKELMSNLVGHYKLENELANRIINELKARNSPKPRKATPIAFNPSSQGFSDANNSIDRAGNQLSIEAKKLENTTSPGQWTRNSPSAAEIISSSGGNLNAASKRIHQATEGFISSSMDVTSSLGGRSALDDAAKSYGVGGGTSRHEFRGGYGAMRGIADMQKDYNGGGGNSNPFAKPNWANTPNQNIPNQNAPNPFPRPIPKDAPPQGGIEGGVSELVPVAKEIVSAIKDQGELLPAEAFQNFSSTIQSIGELSETITTIPTLISESVGELIMTHAITGNMTFEFNNELIEGMLTPVVKKAIMQELARPMVLDFLARGLSGYIKDIGGGTN